MKDKEILKMAMPQTCRSKSPISPKIRHSLTHGRDCAGWTSNLTGIAVQPEVIGRFEQLEVTSAKFSRFYMFWF